MTLQQELQPLTMATISKTENSCCNVSHDCPGPTNEKAGYNICSYVEKFHQHNNSIVPRIKTYLQPVDWLGIFRVRLGICRNNYKVAPGLYCTGEPDSESPLLVTANYKFSFDCLRRELGDIDSWIMVLDTRGVNVWCAAGKKIFSTQEIIRQVKETRIKNLITHREIILPQLGAPGVSAQQVKKNTGLKVIYGPVRADDIKTFLNNNKMASTTMRQVTFTLPERLALIPLEMVHMLKPSLAVLISLFFLSGFNQDLYSFKQIWTRFPAGFSAYTAGLFSGTVLTPILLPWIPGRSFYLKGIIIGIPAVFLINLWLNNSHSIFETIALISGSLAISSYTAMNFTGASTFTSPSGVEKEMRIGIPIQVIAAITSLVTWIIAPFFR